MNKNGRFESRVLSGQNRLSAKEKEAIFASILKEKQAREHRALFRPAVWVPVGVAASLACAIGLFFLFQGPNNDFTGLVQEPEFAPRGADRDRPVARVRCVNESDSTKCVPGSKMLFEVHAPQTVPYFAAFTTVENSGVSIWYFPETGGDKSISLTNLSPDGILPRSGVIGNRHAPGTHTLYGIFSKTPLSRDDIKALFAEGIPDDDDTIAVSKSRFEVEAKR